MGNPRVMFMIDEQNIGDSKNRYHYLSVDINVTENSLLNKFIEKGFECVDPATVRQNLQQDQAIAVLQGNTQMAAAIAKKLGAEVVITGKAIAKVASGFNLGGMKSCQANITARVIKADVATIIATSSAHAAYPHIDEVTGGTEAIKKASNKLADDLINKITKKWKDEFYRATTVKVVVHGIKSFSQVNDFKNTLKYLIRGVKDIYSRNVTGSMAELDVKITNYVEDENGCIEPEEEAGDPGGQGDLHLALKVAIFIDKNQNGVYDSWDLELCYEGSVQTYPGNKGGDLHYSDPQKFAGRTYDDVITMSPGEEVNLVVAYKFPHDSYAKPDAIFMTDKLSFDIDVSLEQVGAP